MSTEAQEQQLVDFLRARMLAKLRANSHKGDWLRCDFRYLMVRLRNETNELAAAWRKSLRRRTISTRTFSAYVTALTEQEREALIDECADIANFAAMIADMVQRGGGT